MSKLPTDMETGLSSKSVGRGVARRSAQRSIGTVSAELQLTDGGERFRKPDAGFLFLSSCRTLSFPFSQACAARAIATFTGPPQAYPERREISSSLARRQAAGGSRRVLLTQRWVFRPRVNIARVQCSLPQVKHLCIYHALTGIAPDT